MKKATNWERYYQQQMKEPELRALVEAELRALRVGAHLARLRERRGLSQTQLAARAGMSAPNVSRIETSPAQNLTLGTLMRLAGALNYNVGITFHPRRKAGSARSASAIQLK
jgi:transcriptional regulator with XRE-family HTH domain